MTAKVEGLDKLLKKLDRLPAAVSRKIETQVLLDAGEIIAARARELVAVDRGDLRDSITVSERLRGYDGQGLSLTGSGHASVYIGPQRGSRPDGWHGHLVEWGTVNMAAQPFMRPAWDETKGQVRSRIANDLGAAIMKAAKG